MLVRIFLVCTVNYLEYPVSPIDRGGVTAVDSKYFPQGGVLDVQQDDAEY